MKILPVEFEIPFYKITCHNWLDKKEKLKNLIEKNIISFSKNDSKSSVNTTYFKNNFNEDIFSIINNEIKQFEQESGLKVCCDRAWFQVYNFGEDHIAHNHGLGYSCVLFINFVKGVHKPTHFLSPFLNGVNGVADVYCPDVNEGDMLFFPSTLIHCVPSNRSEISRIIASINFTMIPSWDAILR